MQNNFGLYLIKIFKYYNIHSEDVRNTFYSTKFKPRVKYAWEQKLPMYQLKELVSEITDHAHRYVRNEYIDWLIETGTPNHFSE